MKQNKLWDKLVDVYYEKVLKKPRPTELDITIDDAEKVIASTFKASDAYKLANALRDTAIEEARAFVERRIPMIEADIKKAASHGCTSLEFRPLSGYRFLLEGDAYDDICEGIRSKIKKYFENNGFRVSGGDISWAVEPNKRASEIL